jgi:hypothetical protein
MDELRLKSCLQTPTLMLQPQSVNRTILNPRPSSRMRLGTRRRGVEIERGRYRMTDNTRMTDGIHNGTRMKSVPAAPAERTGHYGAEEIRRQ